VSVNQCIEVIYIVRIITGVGKKQQGSGTAATAPLDAGTAHLAGIATRQVTAETSHPSF
jgi:hypothetical protein